MRARTAFAVIKAMCINVDADDLHVIKSYNRDVLARNANDAKT